MQMINVLKRLAELDANNPNIIKESLAVEECGPMGMMGSIPSAPSTPASINMTAGSGGELSDMLTTIMSLAGINKAEPAPLAVEPAVMTAEPAAAVGDRDDMRSVLDKLNPDTDGEEETDEGEYDNSPADAEPEKPFNANEFANQENQPGAGDTPDGQRRAAFQPATFEGLMSEYKKFISEN
jgi:hypothetical protein